MDVEDKQISVDLQVSSITVDKPLMEANTTCSQSQHLSPEKHVEQELEELINTTQAILELESNTDEVSNMLNN